MEGSKVLYLRNVPTEVINKLKAAAALDGISLQVYAVRLLQAHVAELERRGFLPKNKSKWRSSLASSPMFDLDLPNKRVGAELRASRAKENRQLLDPHTLLRRTASLPDVISSITAGLSRKYHPDKGSLDEQR
jgi:plasmid stability protein